MPSITIPTALRVSIPIASPPATFRAGRHLLRRESSRRNHLGAAYIRDDELWMDIGKGEVIKLPEATREAWWTGTDREWPLMPTDMGISRDTLMAHYMSNHVAIAYGDIFDEMVALSQELGFRVRILRESKA